MRIQSNIKSQGTVEDLFFANRRDIHYIRTKAAKVNQASIAIKNAGILVGQPTDRRYCVVCLNR